MIKKGDIIFVHTRFQWNKPMTWLSFAIRKAAKMYWNHVALAEDNNTIVEALGKGVVSTKIEKWLKKHIGSKILIRRPVLFFDKVFDKRIKEIKNHTKYDIRGLTIDQLLLNVFHIWVGAKSEKKAKRRMYCYEFYCYAYKEYFKPFWWEQIPKYTIYKEFSQTIEEQIIKG